MSRQAQTSQSARGASTTAANVQSRPGATAGGYSAEYVQRLIDRAAYFSLYSSPEPERGNAGEILYNGGRIVGFRMRESLCRFEAQMEAPSAGSGLRATNSVGGRLGRFSSRWLLCPDGYAALPGREPPPTPLDPARRQRFVMLDGGCEFGGGRDGFRGFGAGATFPTAGGGLLAAAVGNLTEGWGRLSGLEGTYTYCGSISEEGFRGSLMLRVMDPLGVLDSGSELPALDAEPWPEPGVTYIIFRGQAQETDKVIPLFDPGGRIVGMNVAQQLRLFQTDAAARGRGELRSTQQVGRVIGEIDAQITFDPTAPGGGPLDPIPYSALDEFKFIGGGGRAVGSLFIDECEGRTFNTQLAGAPGQPVIRFGGFGPVLRGTGSLDGVEGLMTDNSVVSFTPHVSASVYVIRVRDREGRYRAGGRGR